MYTYEEAFNASLSYFNNDELAVSAWLDKYALRDNDNNILEKTPTDTHHRMAKEFARIEDKKFKNPLTEEEIFQTLDKFKRIIPQGSIMYGLGNPYQYVSLANCFILPSPYDSYPGIMYTDTQITQISCRRGGSGWSVSTLRPKGLGVKNAAKSTTGTISFMHRYSNTVREVCHSGRRGASLQAMHVNHPEIIDFIKVKRDRKSITGSNISVQFTDRFMRALEQDKIHTLKWPVDANGPDIKIQQDIPAKDIWQEFITGAKDYAEPGAQFINKVHSESTCFNYGEQFHEIASNPCGEQMGPAFMSCRLLAINLLTYVQNPHTSDAYFDYKEFYKDCKLMQRIADNVVDLELECIDRIIQKINDDPEPLHIKQIAKDLWTNIKEMTILDRRTGCGFTALGDALAALGHKYNSKEALKTAEDIQKNLKWACYESSVDMAEELGAFSLYNKDIDIKSAFIRRIEEDNPVLYTRMEKFGRRNMVLLTLAPTGTVSCLTQTTSGIEPVFKYEYTRRKKIITGDKNFRVDFVDKNGDQWQHFNVLHKGLQDWLEINPEKEIENSPYYQSQANDVDWECRVLMQAALQKHIDNSISITINLPSDTSYEVVDNIYRTAWKLGCKGCTVYREGCRDGVLISKIAMDFPEKRPREIDGDVYHVSVKGQQYFVLIGLINDTPYEIFAGKNNIIPDGVKKCKLIRKRKGFYKALFDDEDETELSPITSFCTETEEAITRLGSALLRTNKDINLVVTQLEKTGGNNSELHGFVKAIARTLKKYIANGTIIKDEHCPECQSELIRQEGCVKCPTCSYSKC